MGTASRTPYDPRKVEASTGVPPAEESVPTYRSLKRASRSSLVAVVALLLVVSSADAAGVSTAKATTSNPFAHCTIGASTSWATTNYANAEVEPWLSVNPTNAKNVVGVVQQDRWDDGGAHGLVAMVSKDSGRTFKVVPLPFSRCAPGGLPYERASDPWISFGPDGTAYSVSISFDENSARSAVGAATSTDGGMTWGHVTTVASDTAFFHDKESVTADPTRPGTAYIVWDRSSDAPPTFMPEPSFISITTDYGHTWSAPRRITDSSMTSGDIGNQVVVDPRTGTLYDVFYRFYLSAKVNEYVVIRSTDAGAHWSKPSVIAQDGGIPDQDPHPGGPGIRSSSNAIPEAAIDPVTGQLYAVWEDARFNGYTYNQAVLSTSTDGGKHWSAPAVVSTDTGLLAFNPSVAVAPDGRVAITYYDIRSYDASKPALPTQYWARVSPRGGTAFGPDIAITDKPFDLEKAPNAVGLFLGDYEATSVNGTSFQTAWCGTTNKDDNRTDCYVSTFR
jgi:hypothetical protein